MDLKELLGEELYSQVKEKIGDKELIINDGDYIPRSRLNEETEKVKELTGQLEDRDSQLEELGKKAKDSEELTATIKELQQANKAKDEEYQQKLYEKDFNYKLDTELKETYKARNPKAVRALLDLDAVKLKEGELIGLKEQVEKKQETDKYLFNLEDNNSSKGGSDFKDGNKSGQANPFVRGDNFNLTEQGKLIRNNPKLAKRYIKEAGKDPAKYNL